MSTKLKKSADGRLFVVHECPHCGAKVPYSVLLDDEVECPECGKKFKVK